MLALLVSGLAAAGRMQTGLVETARGTAVAEAAADGAVQRAIYQLHSGLWAADGLPRRVAIGSATVEVTVEDQSERINPNFSPPALLASLLAAAGLPPSQASEVGRRIVDWRTATPFSIAGGVKLDLYRQAGLPYGPPDRLFVGVDEIGQVPGVATDLLDRLRPYISVYQSGDPLLQAGAIKGRAAVQDAELIDHAPVLAGLTSRDRTVGIRAVAVVPRGVRFVRTATVQLRMQPGPAGPSWRILSLD